MDLAVQELTTFPVPLQPLRFDFRNVLGGVLCSLGATLSSAAGVGGGGLFVSIFNLALQYDPKTSTALSQGEQGIDARSLARVLCSLSGAHHYSLRQAASFVKSAVQNLKLAEDKSVLPILSIAKKFAWVMFS